jgi:mono/diheme cytochrome c family protein
VAKKTPAGADGANGRDGDDRGPLGGRGPALVVLAVLVAGAAVLGWRLGGWTAEEGHVNVKVPALSAQAQTGERAFAANCVGCHGVNAGGGETGPPLVHDIYNPGHHADMAFAMAVRQGVRQHHWPYGDMPKQPQVSDEDMQAIIRYVRELQVANGIRYRAHRMQ